MAEESEMRRSVFVVAGALTKFATERKWEDSEYWIYYKTNPDWGKVHFVFVADAFNDHDPHECTNEVWAFLETELADQPEILRTLGLVVRSKKKVDEGGLYSIGPGYEGFPSGFEEFWTFYPAHANKNR